MKEISFISFLLISSILTAQPVKPIQVEYKGALYWKYESVDTANNTPFKFPIDSIGRYLSWENKFARDGKWVSFYKEDSTKVASIFEIKNGHLNGKSTQYYLDGSKESEYEFYNGEENGYVRYWNKEGILTLEHQYKAKGYGYFKSSAAIGEWKQWSDEGSLMRIQNFDKGEYHGIQLEYHENGKIKKQEFYNHDKRDSTLTIFHFNGQIAKKSRYKNGEFVAENPHYEYHPSGKIAGIGNLEDGRKIGKWIYYHENGIKESEGDYGTYIYKHDHGDIYFSVKKEFWNYWYPNGTKKAEGIYNDELIEDMDFSGDPQSAKALRKNHWKYYDINGKEISRSKFDELKIKINDY